VFIESSDLLN